MTTAKDDSGSPSADTALAPRAQGSPAATVTEPQAEGKSSLARSSGVMALGTIGSRLTGFLRTAVLLYAIGTQGLGDSYNVANNLPNAVYNLALGGILTSVVVPLLVKAAKHNRDGGEAYDQRIFTLGVLALGAITAAATAATVPITAIYGHGIGNAATYHLTVIFTYFFLPQIFFYGVSSLAGAILNARGSFASPMWTPIVNNVVVIVVGIALIVSAISPHLLDPGEHLSQGSSAACDRHDVLGIVLQTVAMWPSLHRVGFRWRPRFDFRRAEIGEIGRMSGWMFFYIAATQLSFVTTTIVSNDAGARVCASCAGAGYAAFSNAWQLFQLPYAIVGVSVITAMLPRMSAHAAGSPRTAHQGLLSRNPPFLGDHSAVGNDPGGAWSAAGAGHLRLRQHVRCFRSIPRRRVRRVLPRATPVHALQPAASRVLRDARQQDTRPGRCRVDGRQGGSKLHSALRPAAGRRRRRPGCRVRSVESRDGGVALVDPQPAGGRP